MDEKDDKITGYTALHHACRSGNDYMVDLLLEKEASINIKDGYGYFPFDRAVDQGHQNVVKKFLEKFYKDKTVSAHGLTHFGYEFWSERKAMLDFIWDKVHPDEQKSVLIESAKYGITEPKWLEALIQKNVDVNAVNILGKNALHVSNDAETVKILLDFQVNHTKMDNDGRLPMYYYVLDGTSYGREKVELLIEQDISNLTRVCSTSKSSSGVLIEQIPLDVAKSLKNHSVVEYLQKKHEEVQ